MREGSAPFVDRRKSGSSEFWGQIGYIAPCCTVEIDLHNFKVWYDYLLSYVTATILSGGQTKLFFIAGGGGGGSSAGFTA